MLQNNQTATMQASLSFLLKGVLASAREPEKGYASKQSNSNDASILVFFAQGSTR